MKLQLGERFDRWTVEWLSWNETQARLRCLDCGAERYAAGRMAKMPRCYECARRVHNARCNASAERRRTPIGTRRGARVLVGRSERDGYVIARCDCGLEAEIAVQTFRAGNSCGCARSRSPRSRNAALLSGLRRGQRIGHWTVLQLSSTWARVHARCDCGAERYAFVGHFTSKRAGPFCHGCGGAGALPSSPRASQVPSDLTEAQYVVLCEIERAIARQGYPPTNAEIAEQVQCEARAFVPVAECLRRLEAKGYIERNPKIPRAMRVLKPVQECS